jgi:hypothetical protein
LLAKDHRPLKRDKAPVAQRIEHQTSNLGVARSSRAGRTIKSMT